MRLLHFKWKSAMKTTIFVDKCSYCWMQFEMKSKFVHQSGIVSASETCDICIFVLIHFISLTNQLMWFNDFPTNGTKLRINQSIEFLYALLFEQITYKWTIKAKFRPIVFLYGLFSVDFFSCSSRLFSWIRCQCPIEST